MPVYKLTYFEARGRAEVARLIFAEAEVQYEDIRITGEEWWTSKKQAILTGQLPALEVDGKQINGSRIINRFLAERYGLAGSDDVENARQAGIIDFLDDFHNTFPPDEAKKAEMRKSIEENVIPKYLDVLEKIAASTEGIFMCGSKVTYVDLSIFGQLDFCIGMFPNILEGRPGLKKIFEAVGNLSKIAKWLKDRPVTQY